MMKPNKPIWRIPENLQALIDSDEDLTWETDDWLPVQLTVIGGTEYYGRDIHQSWQIDFEPTGPEFEEANKTLSTKGVESDGFGWSALIEEVVRKHHPEMTNELHFEDTEESTCVAWVESEAACHHLMDVVWTLIHDNSSSD